MIVNAVAQPKLLLILVHEPLLPDALGGGVPFQAGWMVWQRGSDEPRTFATGQLVPLPSRQTIALELVASANATREQHQLTLKAGTRSEPLLKATLGDQLARRGLRGVYLMTPQSPAPSPYALILLSRRGTVLARTYPGIEAMRLDFFRIRADWAVLEVKRWDYRALELLLAEGIEVWVVGIPSRGELVFQASRLSPVVRYAAREPNGLLTSPSTRWNGIIREVDLVPSLYYAITGEALRGVDGAPAFESRRSDWHRFWNGRLVRLMLRETTESVGITLRTDALRRGLEWAHAHQELLPTIRASLLGLGGLWLGTGVLLWRRHLLRRIIRRVFVSGIAVFCLLPAVSVLYAYYPFELWSGSITRDIAALGGWLTLCWVALSLISAAVARRMQMPLLCASVVIAVSVCCIDLLMAGGYGVNRSLLSAGISGQGRMFGANEWFWGFALATGVLAPASWLERSGRTRLGARGHTALGMIYGVLLCLFGLPLLGAALDAWLPMTLAFGLSIGLYTGALSLHAPARQIALVGGVLTGLGIGLTALAILVDAAQPWQRQAGWTRNWEAALGWQVALPQAMLVAGIAGIVLHALRSALQRLWQRAYALNHALLACGVSGATMVLLGKTVAASIILTMALMFALEYLLGGKEWGYACEGNGVAH